MYLFGNWLLTGGLIAATLAAWAWEADRRRARRRDVDRVGFMPWTGVFFLSVFVALLLLALGLRG